MNFLLPTGIILREPYPGTTKAWAIKGTDAELFRVVESLADIIENQINEYAQRKYSKDYVLERFTEVDWNIYEKPSVFSQPDRLLFKVSFHKQPPNWRTGEYYLQAYFSDLSLGDSEETAKAAHFCEQLSDFTHLLILTWAGKIQFGWKNYL